MKNVLTADEIRAAEKCMNARGVDNKLLSLNAALVVADALAARASCGAPVAFFCGVGGNGYDGLIAAVIMKRRGNNTAVYFTGELDSAKARFPAEICWAESSGVPVRSSSEYTGGAEVIVDAIFGIGLNKPITGDIKALIERLNREKGFRLAVDIPSGLNAESGEGMGVVFDADITISFSCYKYGMLFGPDREACGRIIVEDVGIPTQSDIKVFEHDDFEPHKRDINAHKGTMGRMFIIGGSATMIGAPIMSGAAAHAAYLNGAGIVTVCVPETLRVSLTSRAVLSVMKFLKDDKNGFIKFDKGVLDEISSVATSINIGMGMGATPDLKKIIEYLAANYSGNLIIDADGINAIKGDYMFLRDSKAKTLLTPHVGEFRRLTGMDATIDNARFVASETNSIVVLKSATTIITDGSEVRLNVYGTPAMAKAGTGDILGGCITALSCSYSLFDAATIACYRNGLGARRAVSSYAEMMLTPRDILNMANYPEL